MGRLPRILVADSRGEVAGIVRAALELLNRRAIVVEVPDGEGALDEIDHSIFDVLLTDGHLPDMTGLELAKRARPAALEMRLIVLSDEEPPDEEEVSSIGSLAYLVRPVDAEKVILALRQALEGEEFNLEPEALAVTEEDPLGPVPEIDTAELRGMLSSLLSDVGAMAIFLADRRGRLLVEQGAVGYLDREKLGEVLGPSFAANAKLAPMVGGNPFVMQFYNGEHFDIYGLSLGLHHFVCLVFEGSTGRGAFGSVLHFGRRAVDEMLEVIGPKAFELALAGKGEEKRPEKRLEVKEPSPPKPEPTPVAQPSEPDRSELSEEDLSELEKLLAQAPPPQDAEAFWSSLEADVETSTRPGPGGEGSLSLDEAKEMGLLPEEFDDI